MHLNQHFNLRAQAEMAALEVLYAGLKKSNSPMKTIWQSRTLKLDSASYTLVSMLLLQWYMGPLCPLRQKPRDVIKCCMFTPSQQDTDQRRTRKAKLINTVSLWTHTADNQSALLLWIRESVQIRGVRKKMNPHTRHCAEMQFTTRKIFPGRFHIYNEHGCRHASFCHTGTHAGTQILKPSIHDLRPFLSYFS